MGLKLFLPPPMSTQARLERWAASATLPCLHLCCNGGKTKLQMPILALGGRSGVRDRLRLSMESLAIEVEGGEIEACGHYVMEEQPEKVSERLLAFLKRVETGRP